MGGLRATGCADDRTIKVTACACNTVSQTADVNILPVQGPATIIRDIEHCRAVTSSVVRSDQGKQSRPCRARNGLRRSSYGACATTAKRKIECASDSNGPVIHKFPERTVVLDGYTKTRNKFPTAKTVKSLGRVPLNVHSPRPAAVQRRRLRVGYTNGKTDLVAQGQ